MHPGAPRYVSASQGIPWPTVVWQTAPFVRSAVYPLQSMPEPSAASPRRPGAPALIAAWFLGGVVIVDWTIHYPVCRLFTLAGLGGSLALATVGIRQAWRGPQQRAGETQISPDVHPLRAEIDVRRELDARLQSDLDTLYLRLAQQQDVIAVIAHEMRTPLSTIEAARQALEALAREAGEEQVLRLRRIRRAVNRLATLAENLQSAHRLEHDSAGLDVSRVALGPFLYEILLSLGLEDRVNLLCPAAPIATGDVGLLDILFTNLVGNAVKYGADGAVTVVLSQTDTHALVVVTDSGPGVPESDLARIFERFYRGGDTRGQSGAGLGLYVALRIAEVHGGSLKAQNRPQGGLEMMLRLPLSGARALA